MASEVNWGTKGIVRGYALLSGGNHFLCTLKIAPSSTSTLLEAKESHACAAVAHLLQPRHILVKDGNMRHLLARCIHRSLQLRDLRVHPGRDAVSEQVPSPAQQSVRAPVVAAEAQKGGEGGIQLPIGRQGAPWSPTTSRPAGSEHTRQTSLVERRTRSICIRQTHACFVVPLNGYLTQHFTFCGTSARRRAPLCSRSGPHPLSFSIPGCRS